MGEVGRELREDVWSHGDVLWGHNGSRCRAKSARGLNSIGCVERFGKAGSERVGVVLRVDGVFTHRITVGGASINSSAWRYENDIIDMISRMFPCLLNQTFPLFNVIVICVIAVWFGLWR